MVKIFIQNATIIINGSQVTDKSQELQGEQEAQDECSPAKRELRDLEKFINS